MFSGKDSKLGTVPETLAADYAGTSGVKFAKSRGSDSIFESYSPKIQLKIVVEHEMNPQQPAQNHALLPFCDGNNAASDDSDGRLFPMPRTHFGLLSASNFQTHFLGKKRCALDSDKYGTFCQAFLEPTALSWSHDGSGVNELAKQPNDDMAWSLDLALSSSMMTTVI